MYSRLTDVGAPFARELMRWRMMDLGQPFIKGGTADSDWNDFMLGWPEIHRAMVSPFGSSPRTRPGRGRPEAAGPAGSTRGVRMTKAGAVSSGPTTGGLEFGHASTLTLAGPQAPVPR
jgi:hypothetical protein